MTALATCESNQEPPELHAAAGESPLMRSKRKVQVIAMLKVPGYSCARAGFAGQSLRGFWNTMQMHASRSRRSNGRVQARCSVIMQSDDINVYE